MYLYFWKNISQIISIHITGVSNVDQGSWIEPSDPIVKMSSLAFMLLKVINFETFKSGIFYKGDFSTKMGIFGPENPLFGVILA